MKTTVDIPGLEDARFTKAKTKREAIVGAVADFNRRMRRPSSPGTPAPVGSDYPGGASGREAAGLVP